MIFVFYTKFYEQLPEHLEREYVDLLPKKFQTKYYSYKFWRDRHRYLFGVLLLREGLRYLKFDDNLIEQIRYTEYNRPILDEDLDFNISHSKNYVVCAVVESARVGIDVEYHSSIHYEGFENVMDDEQWEIIKSSPNVIETFYDYWTIKESVIKADGRGMYVDLNDIKIKKNVAILDSKIWYLKSFNILENASMNVASNIPFQVELKEISFYKKPL